MAAMSTTGALHGNTSLMAAKAPTFNSMRGKLDSALLQALRDMKFEYMTPVQEKVVSGLPTSHSDW